MRTLMTYIKPYLSRLSFQILIKFIGTITDLVLPWLLAYIIDDVVPLNDINLVYLYGGVMIICSIICVFSNVIANRMSTIISREITRKLRHDLFTKVTYLSTHQSDEITSPSLISRLTTDTYNVHNMVDRMQRLGVRAPILVIGGIIVTLTLEPVLTLVLIGTIPILTIIVYFVSRIGVKLYALTQASNDRLVRKVQENITGIRVIKALSKTEYEKGQFDKANKDLVNNNRHVEKTMAITNPAMNLLLNLGLTIVIVLGAFRVNEGLTEPGKIIAFLSYFTIILNALLMVTRMFTISSKGAASAKRIEDILLLPEEMPVGAEEKIVTPYHIEFINVSFSYNKIQNNISNLSFDLKPGETLGIIGGTGSGKTTIIQLLMRFYDVDQGEIRINGVNVKNIPSEILHTMFGVVFQNDFLYSDSIYENIDFGRLLSKDDIEAASKNAQASFIKDKEGDYSYPLAAKGANLSGGQKQRLLIARALAAHPDILILDDSSSALDYLTDATIRESLKKNYADTTSIIIAQRISSVMHLDKILMLDNGHAIGYGTHKELLESCPSYHEIYDAQMGDVMD